MEGGGNHRGGPVIRWLDGVFSPSLQSCGTVSNLKVYPMECLLLRLQRVSSPLVLSEETGH